jgi:hypothetical protein
MLKNNAIREQIISDLTVEFGEEVKHYFNGVGEPIVASDSGQYEVDVPAIAVYIGNGRSVSEVLDEETWEVNVTVEVMDLATNQLHKQLDLIGNRIINAMGDDYNANGLLSLFNHTSFEYNQEPGAPWGSLLINFTAEYEV